MKSLLSFILLFVWFAGYGQSQPDSKRLKQAVSSIEKGECVLLFYEEHFASDFEKKQVKEIEILSQLDFKSIDSIFSAERSPEIRLTLFHILCKKYRSQITDAHLKALSGKEEMTICSGRNTDKGPLNQIAAYLYKNSVERKEKITNPEAIKLVKEARELKYKGPVDFEKMISKLNEANRLEPNNPIILSALGNAKFDSKIDVEGALTDFRNAITYSLDQNLLEIRHYNLGLNLMGMGDIEAACNEWKMGGENSVSYLEEYCQPFDTTIYQSPDQGLILKLSLQQDTAFIVSSHNSPAMSYCYAELVIENKELPKITVKEGGFNYDLENKGSELYLEAVSADGRKFHFFTESEIFSYGNEKEIIIAPKGTYTETLNLTMGHQFPNAGTYQVRIAMRPTGNIQGLSKTYYSNWQTLVIIPRYQRD